MMELKQIYQRFFNTGLIILIIIPTILLSQDPPVEFTFNQSTVQAFYLVNEVTLNGVLVEPDDWVAAFKGDVCVGAKQWDTSSCGGGICDLPVMGQDQAEFTESYMQAGDIPTFKIYDTSSNTRITLRPGSNVSMIVSKC